MNDTQIYFGGEVKSLGDGKIGGYLVRFGDAFKTDLEGDFFTPETDFDVDWTESVKSSVYFNHGLDATLGKKKLGNGKKGTLKKDEIGVWIDAQLDERDEYEKAILDLAKEGKMGWSSGTAAHLIEREKIGRSTKILKWGLGLDATITPTPAESRNVAVSLKSWAKELKAISDYTDSKNDSWIGDNITNSLTVSSLSNASDTLEGNLMWQIIYNDNLSDEDKIKAITEAYQELASFAPKVAEALLSLDTDELESQKSLAKSLAFVSPDIIGDGVKAKITLGKHAEQLLKQVAAFKKRASSVSEIALESGIKKGAMFNSTNKENLLKIGDNIISSGNDMISHGQSLKDLVSPDKEEQKSTTVTEIDSEAALSVLAEFLSIQAHTI